MDKLIPLIDYVLEQDLPQPIGRTAGQMVKYGLFLRQKLELWMFVPCKLVDDVWIILEEPVYTEPSNMYYNNSYVKEYKEAKDRCLFEGVTYIPAEDKNSYDIIRICKEISVINYPKFWKDAIVESLIPYNLILTETAKKIINS